jgi:hypothetical protein
MFAVFPAAAWCCYLAARLVPRQFLRTLAMSASGFMALVSSAYLLLAWPGGPTDISYVWRFLGISLLPVVFALSFWLAGRIRNVWLRRSSRTLASLMLVPSVLFLLLSSLSEAGCKRRIEPDLSPDGSHIVLIEIIPGGALNEDFAHIIYAPTMVAILDRYLRRGRSVGLQE